jgi:predicted nucleic acid-binding protein
MRIVIDANMIIAALVRDSKAREIIMSGKLYFISPDFVLDEIYKYGENICEKSGISKIEFELMMALIFQRVSIINADYYKAYEETAKEIMKEDVKDIPYVACSLALKCDGIWTNDSDFENIKEIKIFSTKELLKLIE